MFVIVLDTGKIPNVSFVTRFDAIVYAKAAGFKYFVITSTF